jgi:hypothetical protein
MKTAWIKSLRFWLIAGGALFLVLVIFALRFVVSPLIAEDYYSKRGSIAYYVTIHSSTIKSLPLIKQVGNEEYYSSSGDGPKLPANGVIYLSKEDPKILMESINAFLTSRGFTREASQCSNTECNYKAKGSSIELGINPKGADTQQVRCIEYFELER